MPIEDAARTAVLSRKWKHGWISISKLEFDHSFASKSEKFGCPNSIIDIYGILMLHLGPISEFILSITCPERISEIDRIFHFLSRKSVQELDVCIFQRECDNSAGYILPSHFYSCLQLRHLKIARCTINPPCSFGGFRNLISLELKDLELDSILFENFILKCPLLEELYIDSCNFIESSSIIKINISNLQHFQLYDVGSCFRFTSAPQLKSLKCLDLLKFDFEGAEKSSLDEFCIAMPALESLVVDYYFLQSLEVRDMSSKCGRHPKSLHRLETLEAYGVHLWNKDEVTSLLGLISSSPNLKHLTIMMDPFNNADGMENPFRSLEANHLDCFSCKKLQIVTLIMIDYHESGIDFIKLLLLKSPELKTLYIGTLVDATPDKQLEILKKVTRFRRASAAAEIIFY